MNREEFEMWREASEYSSPAMRRVWKLCGIVIIFGAASAAIALVYLLFFTP